MSRDHVLDPYPKGWANPVTIRADGALTNVWVVSGTTNVAYATGVTFSFTYERGAAGGAVDTQIQVSIYSIAALVPAGFDEWISAALYAAGAVAAGADTQSRLQREYETYAATGVGDESWVDVLELPTPIERIRLRVRESGVPGTPGNFNGAMIVRG